MKKFDLLSPLAKGAICILLGLLFLSIMDAVAKSLMHRYEIMQIVWARYTGQTLLVLILLGAKTRNFLKTKHLPLQFARASMLFAATVFFFAGITFVGLAEATALLQLNPLLITLGAFLFLRESFGPLRLAGVCFGLIGALIIIRPGTEVFSIYSIYPLAAAALFAGYALATRFLSRDEHTWTNFLYTTILGTAFATVFVPFYWKMPDLLDASIMMGMSALGAAGQYLMIRAFFFAEASLLAPFGYSALIFAGIFGMAFFGEFPDSWSYIGAAVVVGAGIFVWKREVARPIPRAGFKVR
ncbi:MAG: DMT family transporter [Albidovulum sp.]|nr:DMT family transporter [Albidovulum sp.]MDE0530870.1 DMT family transporter [Albidovulum sp.]